MIEEEILAMEENKLKVEVAQKIMGIKVEYPFGAGYPYYLREDKDGKMKWDIVPDYPRDIKAAWQVWLAVAEDHPEDWAIYSDMDGEVTVEHYPDDYKGDRESSCGDFSVDGLFPEAMCKAALIQNIRR